MPLGRHPRPSDRTPDPAPRTVAREDGERLRGRGAARCRGRDQLPARKARHGRHPRQTRPGPRREHRDRHRRAPACAPVKGSSAGALRRRRAWLEPGTCSTPGRSTSSTRRCAATARTCRADSSSSVCRWISRFQGSRRTCTVLTTSCTCASATSHPTGVVRRASREFGAHRVPRGDRRVGSKMPFKTLPWFL